MTIPLAEFRQEKEVTSETREGDPPAMQLVTAVQALSHARSMETIMAIVRKAARQISQQTDGSLVFLLRDNGAETFPRSARLRGRFSSA